MDLDPIQMRREGIPSAMLERDGPAIALRRLYNHKKLPLEERCLRCEAATENVLMCYIECESRRIITSNSSFWSVLCAVLLSPLALIIFSPKEETVVEGDDLSVRAPLRLCAACAVKLRKRTMEVREILLAMPIYQPLFQAYPGAWINIPNL